MVAEGGGRHPPPGRAPRRRRCPVRRRPALPCRGGRRSCARPAPARPPLARPLPRERRPARRAAPARWRRGGGGRSGAARCGGAPAAWAARGPPRCSGRYRAARAPPGAAVTCVNPYPNAPILVPAASPGAPHPTPPAEAPRGDKARRRLC